MSDLNLRTYKVDGGLYLKYLMSSNTYEASSHFSFIDKLT